MTSLCWRRASVPSKFPGCDGDHALPNREAMLAVARRCYNSKSHCLLCPSSCLSHRSSKFPSIDANTSHPPEQGHQPGASAKVLQRPTILPSLLRHTLTTCVARRSCNMLPVIPNGCHPRHWFATRHPSCQVSGSSERYSSPGRSVEQVRRSFESGPLSYQ